MRNKELKTLGNIRLVLLGLAVLLTATTAFTGWSCFIKGSGSASSDPVAAPVSSESILNDLDATTAPEDTTGETETTPDATESTEVDGILAPTGAESTGNTPDKEVPVTSESSPTESPPSESTSPDDGKRGNPDENLPDNSFTPVPGGNG